MACIARVVLPDDSGPYISTTLPFGYPLIPKARSSVNDPVGITSTFSTGLSPNFITAPLPNVLSNFSIVSWSAFNFSACNSLFAMVYKFNEYKIRAVKRKRFTFIDVL